MDDDAPVKNGPDGKPQRRQPDGNEIRAQGPGALKVVQKGGADPTAPPEGPQADKKKADADKKKPPDEEMMRAWAKSLVAMVLSQLERVCEEKRQRDHFEMFARRYVEDPDHPPSWSEVGAPFGLDEKTARNRTETVARQFRSLLRQLIASDIGAGEDIGAEANMAKLLAADASWAAADMCVQTHGGFGFAEEYDVERKFRETRLYQVAPISTNMILSYLAEHVLGLPRSY